ncbi:MAG: FecR domain-containing protein, partial [bacterium]|nr:FecR domain-containing protein [bacterium]
MSAMITRAQLADLTPDEAAALFLVQRDEGAPVEAGLFEEWLAQSENNQTAWEAVEGAWSLFDDADDPAFAALREAALADGGSRGNVFRSHWRPIAAAAALLVVVTGALQLRGGGPDRADLPLIANDAAAERIYAAAQGVAKTFVLVDGSAMTLDGGAQAKVAIGTMQRRVILDRGGAMFTVRHDASRPFTVQARDRTIIDVGTRFKVALERDMTRVALYEGSVRIGDAAGRMTVLRPGEQ